MSETLKETLRDAAKLLGVQRSYAASLDAAWKAKEAAFRAQYPYDLTALANAKTGVADLEAEVRALALVVHDTTQDAKPCPGVSIVQTKEYAIDEAQGLAWAISTGLCLIPQSLDVKAVKKFASAVALPFVTVTETPSVRIASELLAAFSEEPV